MLFRSELVERRWQEITKMAQTFLSEAKLPKKFWYWAIWEASICSNSLPITQHSTDINDPKFWSTPHYEFYGKKPDYHIIIFPFGAIGVFCWPSDGSKKRSKYDLQCMLGVALSRSEFTNSMIFYNANLDSFCILD